MAAEEQVWNFYRQNLAVSRLTELEASKRDLRAIHEILSNLKEIERQNSLEGEERKNVDVPSMDSDLFLGLSQIFMDNDSRTDGKRAMARARA